MADELLATPAQVIDAWAKFANLSQTRQTSLIASASQIVHDHCRRWFTQQSVAETLNGRNLPRVWLSHRPVITVETVTVNGDSISNTDGTGWTVNNKTGELIRGNGIDCNRFPEWFPAGTQNVVVQYWAGYAAVPDPVVEATCKTAKWLWDLDQAGGSGVMQSERIGDYSYSRGDQKLVNGLPAHIAVMLADYVQDEAFV